jgi:hypothetical protein
VRKKGKGRSRALARRYGHFSVTMADVNKASGNVRALAEDHPFIAGAAVGAAAGAIAAGTPPSAAAVVGAIAGIAAQEVTGKRR